MKKLIAFLSLMFFLAGVSVADVYIKQNSHTDAIEMMGQSQPAEDEVNHLWLGDDKMAMHSEQQSIIIDLDAGKMMMIDHQDETYVEMELPLDMSKYFPPQMEQMMGQMEVKVTPTTQSQTISGYKCTAFEVDINFMRMNMKQTVWASTDVPFDWKSYSEKMLPMMQQAMMRLGSEALDEFKKIEGFQIKTEMTMNMMGSEVNSYTEVVEIVDKSAPEGTYTFPEGYTKKEKFSMEDLQR
ncbi:MAG: hypothetical protein R6V02_08950 [Candidatus Aminicenantes bacterium]